MDRCLLAIVVLLSTACTTITRTAAAFAPVSMAFTTPVTRHYYSRLYAAAPDDEEDEGWTTTPSAATSAAEAAATAIEDEEKKGGGGDGVLPELKGDFDWDAKFAADEDWITENVPGKIVLNEVELASQVTALGKLEDKWRKERQIQEYEDDQKVGWVEQAETLNGRTAMFFLVTGLLTEYWTGYTFPGQVEEMLRVGGFIGPDY